MNSSTLSRRTILQLAGAAALPLSSGLLSGSAQAAAPGKLTIAYNVNLPRFDPTIGESAVNPTIQSIYQSIFDPYIGQAPGPVVQARPADDMGLERDRTKVMLKLRNDATWHDGSPGDAGRRGLVADPRRRTNGGNPIQFVWSKIGNLQDRRQYHYRRRAGIRADAVQMDGVSHRLCAAEGLFREGRAPKVSRRRRSAAARTRSMPSSAMRSCGSRRNPGYWGGKPAFDDRGIQIRHRPHQPRRRNRIRRVGRDL